MIRFNCYNKIEIKFKIVDSPEELEKALLYKGLTNDDTVELWGGISLDSLLQPGFGVTDQDHINYFGKLYIPRLNSILEFKNKFLYRYSTAWFTDYDTALEFVKLCNSGKNPIKHVSTFKSAITLIV